MIPTPAPNPGETYEKALDRSLRGQEIADIEELLRHEWGRRLFARIVYGVCGVAKDAFAIASELDGGSRAQFTAWNEGQREVGLKLSNEAQLHCPEAWNHLEAERILRRAEEQKLRDAAKTIDKEQSNG